ncbi:YceG family protein [Candidatus Epulonipiscium viviparus]|uniref:YceG family protein n=1 Tax=Candidatus Epulonipiscium viviparus TaxID=420336 RepID=UPI002738156D|nr:YceG family protein [Candidatus Epulopiscium viviparus]
MHLQLAILEDYFKENRSDGFIYRITGKNKYVEDFLVAYYHKAKTFGIIIESKIQNLTEDNIRYLKDILGDTFILSQEFIEQNLKKWLVGTPSTKRTIFAKHLYNTLLEYQKLGKNISILQNTYIKFMCWAYFRFQRVLNVTPTGQKILYIGELSKHEIDFLSIMAFCGIDVLIISLMNEVRYKTLDPADEKSFLYKEVSMIEFAQNYRVSDITELIDRKIKAELERNIIKNYTNDWVNDDAFLGLNIKTHYRNAQPGYFNNIFICFKGADDTVSFAKKLNTLYRHIEDTNRPYIIENRIPTIWPNEISQVKRRMTITSEEDLIDLQRNIDKISNSAYLDAARSAFVKLVKEINFHEQKLNISTNKIVQILALYKRYADALFTKPHDYPPIFILFGAPQNEIEVYFLKFLAKLYVDVVIIIPDPHEILSDVQLKIFKDTNLCVVEYENQLQLTEYPKTLDAITATTNAYEAERDLDTLIYKDTGLYRQHQLSKASSLVLRTTCEEIDILWNEELKFRPNFNVDGDSVCMPVIFAKISGVRNDNLKEYSERIRNFIIPKNTAVCVQPPFIKQDNLQMFSTALFLKNGRLLKNEIQNHRDYKFGHLRSDMQNHLLDKIELLINSKLIEGTGTHGREYLILQTLLNLDNDFLKRMQKFDFTKQNPKVVVLHTKEKMHSIEDAIFLAFANLVGYDIIIMSPTGYRSFERFYTKDIIQEHQDGNYYYDLSASDILEKPKEKLNFLERIKNLWQ